MLEGKETIPENKGIFLNQSFRMRDEINDFISLNFYEGRLKSSQVAQNRSIDFKDSIINSPELITYR